MYVNETITQLIRKIVNGHETSQTSEVQHDPRNSQQSKTISAMSGETELR